MNGNTNLIDIPNQTELDVFQVDMIIFIFGTRMNKNLRANNKSNVITE